VPPSAIAGLFLVGGSSRIPLVATMLHESIGIAPVVAEQPELVVVADQLPTISTADLVRSLRKYSPRTLVTAQVQSDRDVGRMLDAGASAVFSRRVPPAMLCEQVTAYLNDASEDVLLLT
jgi:DNA-binding NarL/FixJ family response regulator